MNIFELEGLRYGGDYNPEQWIGYEGMWDEDIRLMKEARVNCVSLGIFSWSMLEREEGVFDFSWLDEIIDKLYKNGIYVILATPSGARPPWLAQKYPEVLRVTEDRVKRLYGRRHNHCLTSPVYREKTALIDGKLAERYGKHPAVVMWHIGNEFSGECHCERCRARFREWLKVKYHNSLDELNHEWWSAFWSHMYTDWEQIDSPSPIGENGVHAQWLDWRRYVNDMTIDFYENEVRAVRQYSDLPVTTNFMEVEGFDYYKFGKHVDIVSWDCYPRWNNNYESVSDTALWTSFLHDIFRSMKKKPFIMMESTPSLVNWHDTNKLKAPGLNMLASLQAVAHGADAVLYFQMRKSRGSSEKFHGALIDHDGSDRTRVFREAAETGRKLEELSGIKGSYTASEAVVIYDYENSWAIENLCGLKTERGYRDTCIAHYSALRRSGINVDVISRDADLSGYKLVCAPMLYMLPENTAQRLRSFVENGGTLLATYLTSYVNENDLCHLGGFPGGLKDVFGIWNEEIDSLYDENAVISGGHEYAVRDFCERIHPADDTEVLGVYKSDFYAGEPAVTRHTFGEGTAYYIAARTGQEHLKDVYGGILSELGIEPQAECLGEDVLVTRRGDKLFIMNFSDKGNTAVCDGREISLKPYECAVVERGN